MGLDLKTLFSVPSSLWDYIPWVFRKEIQDRVAEGIPQLLAAARSSACFGVVPISLSQGFLDEMIIL